MAGTAQDRPAGLCYTGMKVEEVARALCLSEEHIRRLLRRGELEGTAFGGRIGWRLDRDYVMGLVVARATPGEPERLTARSREGRASEAQGS